MIGKMKPSFLGLISALVITMSVGSLAASAQTPKVSSAHASAIQQPLYGDYKGVRIGMTAEQVRAKLGKPTLLADDQDYYIMSQTETVQIAYDASHKTIAISVDFVDGIGAPDYKAVVGPDIERRSDGSMHKLVNYDSLGFWVSYHRSAGGVTTVTITIQKSIS
jgi:outer membrane protein assembly factor BamE (lipoprotein component of BamABCDE complex)